MKKSLVSILYLIMVHSLSGVSSYPLTIIVHNNEKKPLTLSVEYRLDQYYKHTARKETPLVPNSTHYHYMQKFLPNQQKQLKVFAFHPCAKPYCPLHNSLSTNGFTPGYKTVQGSITVHEHNHSYAFSQSLFDGGTITITVNPETIAISTTQQAPSLYAYLKPYPLSGYQTHLIN